MKILSAALAFAAATFLLSSARASGPLEGTKDIVLHTRNGKAMTIGTVVFSPKGDRTGFDLRLDPTKFRQFFLSMKEFKCVEGGEIFCHVPYPYADPDTVTSTDLSWLEHRLLFFFKQPADYGAKLTNGIIYTMKIADGGIVGTPQGIDLNAIGFGGGRGFGGGGFRGGRGYGGGYGRGYGYGLAGLGLGLAAGGYYGGYYGGCGYYGRRCGYGYPAYGYGYPAYGYGYGY